MTISVYGLFNPNQIYIKKQILSNCTPIFSSLNMVFILNMVLPDLRAEFLCSLDYMKVKRIQTFWKVLLGLVKWDCLPCVEILHHHQCQDFLQISK